MAFNPIGLLAVSTISKKLKKADQAPFLMLGAMAGPRPTDALLPMSLAQKKIAEEDAKQLRGEADVQRAETARLTGELAAAKQSHVTLLRELQSVTDIIDVQQRIRDHLEEIDPQENGETEACDDLDPVVHALHRIANAIATTSPSAPAADGIVAGEATIASGAQGGANLTPAEAATVPRSAGGGRRRN